MAETALAPNHKQSRFASAFRDLGEGLARWRLWTAFAWEDIRQTYHRTLFGTLWISISFAVFVGVKLFVFGSLLRGMDSHYYGAYLLLGFFCWSYIVQAVNTAPMVFITNESWIKNDPLPFSVYAYQSVCRDFFSLFMTLIVVMALYALTKQKLDIHALLAIPALLLLLLNALWVKLFLGVISTRYRDINQLVSTIMRMMIFLTPIFWSPDQMGEKAMKILWWNPFAHFLWIVRTPVLDHQPATESWIFVGVVTVVGWFLALTSFILFRRRIPFWL